jgi:signal transduction histidine kinase
VLAPRAALAIENARLYQRAQDVAAAEERTRLARELTRGALAERCTLLLALRPATLTESSLRDLLRQLTEAFVGRSRLQIRLEIEGEGTLPPDVQVALYRIAQESLNNVSKHAEASQVAVLLRFNPDAVTLSIGDDGRGFDAGSVATESLGLGIMHERAARIGARLDVSSQPGRGTTVTAIWPTKNEEGRH